MLVLAFVETLVLVVTVGRGLTAFIFKETGSSCDSNTFSTIKAENIIKRFILKNDVATLSDVGQ